MSINYKPTMRACYIGYISHAIVNHLVPLLFIIFQTDYQISFEKLGRLILLNFSTQLLMDVITVRVVDCLGYRKLMVAAHFFAAGGLFLLAFLPNLMTDPYLGIVIAVIVYALGGGLIEVLISPIIDSIPSSNKAGSMAFLHSFYCWGQMGVVLLTTLALAVFGRGSWQMITAVWAFIPLWNLFQFLQVPLMPTQPEQGRSSLKSLFSKQVFLVALVMMVCAGSAEHIVSEWSSLFAEKGLGVSKVLGDLLGPCLFAVLMGLGRVAYALWGKRITVERGLTVSALFCTCCYLVIIFSPWAVLSLVACGLCGLSVSLMWPCAISLTSKTFPLGGAAMFGVLAVFGDLGCAVGPWLSGIISDLVETLSAAATDPESIGLKCGIAVGILAPIFMLVCLSFFRKEQMKKREIENG